MDNLNFDQRIGMIRGVLSHPSKGLLAGYELPSNLDTDEKIATEASELIEEINKLVPSKVNGGQMGSLLKDMRANVRKRHGGRAWPSSKVLQQSMQEAIDGKPSDWFQSSDRPRANGPNGYAALRIKTGEPVGEHYLWGPLALRLIHEHGVTEHQLDSYRKGYLEAMTRQYGSEMVAEIAERKNRIHNDALVAWEASQ